jgi:hypothetical protein
MRMFSKICSNEIDPGSYDMIGGMALLAKLLEVR